MTSRLDTKIPPPVVAVATAAAMWALARVGPHRPLDAASGVPLAIGLAIVGVGFDLAGLVAFRRARTTINPMTPQRTSALVTGGVYRITRNPMYVGLALLLCAWAIHLAAWWPWLGPPLFVAWITRFQIRPEEHAMERLFGDDFRAYAARVRRWL
jgi:protein-S-isoprenylcysteine O-methyltransferase Ste14